MADYYRLKSLDEMLESIDIGMDVEFYLYNVRYNISWRNNKPFICMCPEGDAIFYDSSEPVSYTHLTLPTNMNYIKDFLNNTPEDIYDFSDKLEGFLIIHYDEMYREQPQATKILNEEVPDICAAAEPGMKSEEIEEFKQKLEIEYNKAFKALII